MIVKFFIPWTVTPKGNSKKIVRFGKFTKLIEPKRSRDNANALILLAGQHRPDKPMEGPIMVTYRFQFAWRKSETKKRRAESEQPHDVRPDLGNLCKQLDDALESAGFFHDDAQIASYGDTHKVWTNTPGVDVRIETLSERNIS